MWGQKKEDKRNLIAISGKLPEILLVLTLSLLIIWINLTDRKSENMAWNQGKGFPNPERQDSYVVKKPHPPLDEVSNKRREKVKQVCLFILVFDLIMYTS